MRDIPVFTTQYGVASLVLKEIPYKKRAHITLQATRNRKSCWRSVCPSAAPAVRNGSMLQVMCVWRNIRYTQKCG